MIKCLLIDDEPLAIGILEDYVKNTPFLTLVASCSNAIEALQKIEDEDIDLIFSDIQMPNISGIEFSKMILNKNIKIIFTTAFEEYALESYKVNAIDYLLKPISYPEFLVAVNKAKTVLKAESVSYNSEEQKTDNTNNDDYIFVKSEYKLVKIELKNILYIEGLKDYVKFYTQNSDKPIMSLMSLKYLEEELTSKKFMRVHRSFIVNLKRVKIIERNRIIFGDKYIPISEKYKENFQNFIKLDL